MCKITVFITLILIVAVAYATSLSCKSCGNECVASCGTRRFRTCCFNYLRKKRGHDADKFPALQFNREGLIRQKFPVFIHDDPEQWSIMSNDYQPNDLGDMVENGFVAFDA